MSRGQFVPRNHSDVVLERCRTRRNIDEVVIIDVDEGEADYVSADTPLSSYQETRAERPNEKPSCGLVISIDDEESSDGSEQDKNTDIDTSSSYYSEDNECVMISNKGKSSYNLSKNVFPKGKSSQNILSFNNAFVGVSSARESIEVETTESCTSESDSSDCEILDDSSGNIREEWEKAASKKRVQDRSQMSEEHAGPSGSDGNSRNPCNESAEREANIIDNKCSLFSHQNHSKTCSASPSQSSAGGSMHKAPETSDSFFRQKPFTVPPCSADAEELNTGIPSPYENSCIFSQDAPAEQPLFGKSSGELQADKYFNYSNFEASIWNKDVLGESSFYAERNSQDINMKNSSPYTKQSDEAQIHSSPGLNNTKENFPSKSFGSNQGHHNTTHDNASFRHKYYQASGEPSLNTFCGHQQTPLEVASNLSPFGSKSPDEKETVKCPLSLGITNTSLEVQNYFISEREKHKESDEYRRAQEEEWASRQEQLRIQAEEARRMRRRRKAASMRLLDMEKRQKQRLEEVRESQKKDEETTNLKEKFRAEVRKELDKMEIIYRDMASLLRALGISVDGGRFPLTHEVNAAYKKALLRFHPDRASRADIRQQVESEEKFKLISRLKEKLLPAAH